MDRNQYLIWRTNNSPNPMYEYYKENYKGTNPLNMEDFFNVLRIWPHANEAYGRVLAEYDIKYEIMTISNVKTEQVIKYL